MSKLVFLGGTSANNSWRQTFTDRLVALGVPESFLFNPVVKDWNEDAQAAEETAKATADFLLFYIADPQQEGNPLSVYSMVEATMALYDKAERSVVVFDTDGMSGHPLKAMNQTAKILKTRFPEARIFSSLDEAVTWFANELK